MSSSSRVSESGEAGHDHTDIAALLDPRLTELDNTAPGNFIATGESDHESADNFNTTDYPNNADDRNVTGIDTDETTDASEATQDDGGLFVPNNQFPTQAYGHRADVPQLGENHQSSDQTSAPRAPVVGVPLVGHPVPGLPIVDTHTRLTPPHLASPQGRIFINNREVITTARPVVADAHGVLVVGQPGGRARFQCHRQSRNLQDPAGVPCFAEVTNEARNIRDHEWKHRLDSAYMQNMLPDPRGYQCPRCDVISQSAYTLDGHYRKKHKEVKMSIKALKQSQSWWAAPKTGDQETEDEYPDIDPALRHDQQPRGPEDDDDSAGGDGGGGSGGIGGAQAVSVF